MSLRKIFVLAAVVPCVLAAWEPGWREKAVATWTQDDAKELLTDSPWAKRSAPSVSQSSDNGGYNRGGRGMGRGPVSINLPGMGGPRMGGGRGGGYPRGGGGGGQRRRDSESEAPIVTVRWESSAAVQAAVLKAKEEDAPSVDAGHYTIAVIGLPRSLARDPQMAESKLKSKVELKRDGKKFAKATDVRVIVRDDQAIVLYRFDRKKEITRNDTDIQIEAHLGKYLLRERFNPSEMWFEEKLAL